VSGKGIDVDNPFGSVSVDTVEEAEVCLPSVATPV